jgi:hypothetical protein
MRQLKQGQEVNMSLHLIAGLLTLTFMGGAFVGMFCTEPPDYEAPKYEFVCLALTFLTLFAWLETK